MTASLRHRYWAFISYSHADEDWAKWLHKALESYRVPARLVGRAHPDGPIPKRLIPIFRDREELPSSHELGAVINRALHDSRYLIVICSPRSAQSRWVEEEIRTFKRLGRENRVLALIVDGEPHAADPAQECFPTALKVRMDGGGGIEPIAADARPSADHKHGARLKLIAGLLGVGYDELVQRERQRQRWLMLGQAATALAIGTSLFAVWQWQAQRWADEASALRRNALIELGRRELVAGAQARAAAYLSAAQQLGADSPGLRLMLGNAMRAADALKPYRIAPLATQGYVAVDASPDGRWLAMRLSGEDQVRLWDARRGEPISSLPAKRGQTIALRFSADSRWLALSSQPDFGTIVGAETVIWEFPGGRERLRAAGHFSGPSELVINSAAEEVLLATIDGLSLHRLEDGDVRWRLPQPAMVGSAFTAEGYVLVGEADGTLSWRSAEDGRELRRVRVSPEPQSHVPVPVSDGRVLTVPERGTLKLFSAEGELLDALCGHSARAIVVNRNIELDRVATQGHDGVRLWSLAPAGALLSVPHLDRGGGNPGMDSLGSYFVSPEAGNAASLWNVETRSIDAQLDAHATGMWLARFVDEDQRIVTVGGDGSAYFWDVATLLGTAPSVFAHPSDAPTGVMAQGLYARFSPDGRRVLTVATDGSARTWDVETGAPIAVYRHANAAVRAAAWVDGEQLLTATADAEIKLWRDGSEQSLEIHRPSVSKVRELVVSPDRSQYLVLGIDAELGWYSLAGGARLSGHADASETTIRLALSPDGERVITAGRDGTVWIWRRDNGQTDHRLAAHDGRALNVAFSPDGRLAASSGADSQLHVWDADNGKKLATLSGLDPRLSAFGGPGAVRFSEDSSRLYSEGELGGGILWDWRTDHVQVLDTGGGIAYHSTLSPDESLFAVGSEDGNIHVFDTSTGKVLLVLHAHPGAVAQWLQFSPDGRRLLSLGQWDHRAKLWTLPRENRDTAAVAELVRCRVPWVVTGEALQARALNEPGCWPETK